MALNGYFPANTAMLFCLQFASGTYIPFSTGKLSRSFEAMYQSASAANEAANNANEAASKAAHTAKSLMVVGEAEGSHIFLDDAIDQYLVGLRVFGKTTQNGTPTPDSPVELESIPTGGLITVDIVGGIEDQNVSFESPEYLHGIPVSSGGNYTDANGQQWICDEIDFARGVYVQRIGLKVFTGSETYLDYISSTGGVSTYLTHLDNTHFICSHFIARNTAKWANTGAVLFYIAAAGCATKDEFVAFVTEQYTNGTPIEIAYILPTPVETPLSEEDLATFATLHTYRGSTTVSNDANAWMNLEYVMDAKKYIDSLVTAPPARLSTVTLSASKWAGSNSLYSQAVTIPGITENSKVDLLPSVEQLAIFFNKNVAFITENEDGVVTVYAIGDKPTNDYTMQVQITEVEA